MDAKRFFGAFDVECCLSFSASLVEKKRCVFFPLKKHTLNNMNQPNDKLRIRIVVIISTLCMLTIYYFSGSALLKGIVMLRMIPVELTTTLLSSKITKVISRLRRENEASFLDYYFFQFLLLLSKGKERFPNVEMCRSRAFGVLLNGKRWKTSKRNIL